jgi:hypothetical protein
MRSTASLFGSNAYTTRRGLAPDAVIGVDTYAVKSMILLGAGGVETSPGSEWARVLGYRGQHSLLEARCVGGCKRIE